MPCYADRRPTRAPNNTRQSRKSLSPSASCPALRSTPVPDPWVRSHRAAASCGPVPAHREERRAASGGARSGVPERVRAVSCPSDTEPAMRTSETLLLDFIRQSPQLLMPVNQRRYAWTRREWSDLWEHILDAGERDELREHFLGPVMYLAAVDPLNAHWSPRLVYDGQQRLTTVTLILKALARHLKDDDAPDGFEADQIRTEYLLNAFGKGDQHYRLLLKPGDAETLLAMVHDRPMPARPSPRILEAFAFFEKRIRELGPDVSALCAGLRKLRIVAFDLKEGEDNPHRIFETMNACGRDLSCADMIGNFILMPLHRERQERIHADHLRPIERGFERHGGEHFDAFIRHYLTLGTGEVPRQGEEYAAFKDYAGSRRVGDAGPQALASDLRSRADHYRAVALGEETDAELALAFGELASLDMKPVWPFLLHLYGDYSGGRLSKHDLLSLTRLVTAYAMRRAVCGYKPAAPPAVFASAPGAIDAERHVESVRAFFLNLPDGHAFLSDDAFRAELATRNMYRFRHRDTVLERLENHTRKEPVQLASCTVEHIMPQGERLPAAWKEELGPDWAQIWHAWRHTVGNLTVTGYNSEMGNAPFREKRDAERGVPRQPVPAERRSAPGRALGRGGDPRPRRTARRGSGRDLAPPGASRPGVGLLQGRRHRGRRLHDRASSASAARRADARSVRGPPPAHPRPRPGGPRRGPQALCRLQVADQLR